MSTLVDLLLVAVFVNTIASVVTAIGVLQLVRKKKI